MEHKGTVRLETDRLILRRYKSSDAEAIFNNWASDDEVTRFLTWPTHPDINVTRFVLEDWISSYPEDNYYHWAIVLKENGDEPVGGISAVKVDDKIGKVEIGYCIGRRFWHQGITSEALECLIPFFFEQVKVNRIEARYDPHNPNSGKVMAKCGLKYEGTQKQADLNNQGIVDQCLYGLVREEWKG